MSTFDNINKEMKTLFTLMKEQEPERFLSNLCMFSLDILERKYLLSMQRHLAELLR